MGRPKKQKTDEPKLIKKETVKPGNETIDVAAMAIPEDDSKAGKKLTVVNEDGINRPSKGDAPRRKAPSYFISSDDEILVEVDILFRTDDGQIVNATLHEDSFQYDYSILDDNPYLIHRLEWFKFIRPKYFQVNIIRQECLKLDPRTRKMNVDPVEFRQRCLYYFLKDWSLVDENGDKIVLEMTEDGHMSNAALQKVQDFNTSVMDVAMTKFETEAGL